MTIELANAYEAEVIWLEVPRIYTNGSFEVRARSHIVRDAPIGVATDERDSVLPRE